MVVHIVTTTPYRVKCSSSEAYFASRSYDLISVTAVQSKAGITTHTTQQENRPITGLLELRQRKHSRLHQNDNFNT
jgi:hypothetical protein